jgi:GNAT superfamily N-acetyltransferase
MTTTQVNVRPPSTDEELNAFFRLAAWTFVTRAETETAAADLRRFVTEFPEAGPTGIRGAFGDGRYLGGYLIDERWLRIGAARLRTGWIGYVVTDPDYRGRGVATALMRDALAYAHGRGQVLLVLNGLPDFYAPFGYVDVFDATFHAVERDAVLALPESPYRVRPATGEDVPAMLGLYDRHYGSHPGSVVRTAEQQAFLIDFAASCERSAYRQRDGLPYRGPVVGVDDEDRPRGYLSTPWGPKDAFGYEVAADDWPAILALLQYQARSLDLSPDAPAEVRWPLPPDSLTAYALADHCVVQSRSTHRPRANWEASVIDVPGLLGGMLPAWEERLRRCPSAWTGDIGLAIDGEAWTIRREAAGLQLCEGPTPRTRTVELGRAALAPLLFGFRSVAWAAQRSGQELPDDLRSVLGVLFPPVHPWIAPMDGW